MERQIRILISGAAGFIGANLARVAYEAGIEAILVDRTLACTFGRQCSVSADLLDSNAAISALSPYLPVDVVIHLAALAHNQVPPPGHDVFSANLAMMRTLLRAVQSCNPLFIFTSSVAVYGEAGRGSIISASEEPRPATAYGRSKLEGEHILSGSALSDIEVLRLAPVYNAERLADVSKRVFLPMFSSGRMWIIPEPRYSFCDLGLVVQRIMDLIRKGRQGRRLRNVCDPVPYGQHQIAAWFKGPRFPVFSWLGLTFSLAARFLPGASSYRIRCDLHKLFFTHLYDPQPVDF